MAISQRDIDHIFERLRSGTVPERGLDAFAVGIDRQRGEIARQLELAGRGEGGFKFLRGGYGTGKTFMSRLTVLDAQAAGFATSFVVVSDNDLKFYRFDELYRKIVQELSTPTCPRGALGDIIDRWIGQVEESLIAGGADEEAADFDDKVAERLKADLASLSGGEAPDDMGRVLTAIFELKQQGRLQEAAGLIAWLGGSTNVSHGAKKIAGIKGDIGSPQALAYLRGVLAIARQAGYKGMVVVVDEVETIMRSRSDTREKSLNGLRQIIDEAAKLPGMLWVFTGTPTFFDTHKGVKGLPPLYDRISFRERNGAASLRQPQLKLDPMTRERLEEVALKLRELYPSRDKAALHRKRPPETIKKLIDAMSEGFAQKQGVIPRQFLRVLVDELDLAEDSEGSDPIELRADGPPSLDEQDLAALADEADDGGAEVVF